MHIRSIPPLNVVMMAQILFPSERRVQKKIRPPVQVDDSEIKGKGSNQPSALGSNDQGKSRLVFSGNRQAF